VKGWEDRYGIPVFTSGMNQIRALRAVGAKRIVGSGYDSITGPIVEDYFRDAGFDVIKIEKAPFTWEQTGELTDDEMIDYLVSVYRRFPGGEAMYIQGSKWPSMRVVGRLEKQIGVPVVQAVTARCWEIQVRCGILRPQSGYGMLLEKMPQG
jgi:maleate cis-trans isomerase